MYPTEYSNIHSLWEKENADMNPAKYIEAKGTTDGSFCTKMDVIKGTETPLESVPSREYILNQEAIKVMVETRAAQAVAKANALRDNAVAKLQEERVAREAFEAELEAQTRELVQMARHEEQAHYQKFVVERETLITCLSDSNNMKKILQDKITKLEDEITTLRRNDLLQL